MHEYTVYILRCSDGFLYSGMTRNLSFRLYQHENAVFTECYTVKRRAVSLVYTAAFTDVHDAISCERRLKRWSRRKKEALIAGEFEDLKWYSKRKNVQQKGVYGSNVQLKGVYGSRVDCHPEVRAEPQAKRATKDQSTTSP